MEKSNKKKPTWSDLKRQLANLERPALVGLIQDLYAASKNKAISVLEPNQQEDFVERLEHVRNEGHNWGWGVGEDMDYLLVKYGFVEDCSEV